MSHTYRDAHTMIAILITASGTREDIGLIKHESQTQVTLNAHSIVTNEVAPYIDRETQTLNSLRSRPSLMDTLIIHQSLEANASRPF